MLVIHIWCTLIQADPTADVEGLDVQAKIAILCKLAFGVTINPGKLPTKGISKLTSDDFAYAKTSLKSTIKLLGVAMVNADKTLSVFVSPVVVPLGTFIYIYTTYLFRIRRHLQDKHFW
jgi:homoserine dehydrogenase